MKKILSRQIYLRILLIGLTIFIWGYKMPMQYESVESLFCYMRDVNGNKALIRDNGAVFVEDIFVMEIPKKSWDGNENVTITVILEDQEGNRKMKKIRLYGKES